METLFVVGLGPGDPSVLTPQARAAILRAEVLIAYEGYFELMADLTAGKECLALKLGEEVQRAELAAGLARQGRRVCVVSSGDPGVYGMAGIVMEAADDVDVVVVPGVSAVNGAAALLGAPLGHDFAVVSLSDLLTPWPIIERRLAAAAAADFVIALVNPCSRRRDWQLGRACAILLETRARTTPVGVVRHAYRAGQSIVRTTLAELDQTAVDMFTTVIIGSSSTRLAGERIVTPRGYRLRSEAS